VLVLVALVLTVGIADSVNPSTVAPALFLATRRGADRSLAAFTAGVFTVYTLGGFVLTLGPGQAALAALPRPDKDTAHEVELAAGGALLLVAAVLWFARERIARRVAPEARWTGRSAFFFGAAIMAVELPTAFPYFAAIAAIVGSNRSLAVQSALILLFNVAFVAPLIAIAVTRRLAGPRGERALETVRAQLDRRGAVLIPALVLLVALVVLTLGLAGILRS
jgi:cytochrome c biogenesis protein CcdA